MNIFYIRYESTPTPESDNFEEFGGAYINCWVKAQTIDDAKLIAENTIKENCWKIIKLEESFIVDASLYKEDKESLECFEQAQIDGDTYVFHTWSNNPDTDEMIH